MAKKKLVKDSKGNKVEPLFKGINEPKVDTVGHIMSMNCGHNGKPNQIETSTIFVHLEAAGFIKPYHMTNTLASAPFGLIKQYALTDKASVA